MFNKYLYIISSSCIGLVILTGCTKLPEKKGNVLPPPPPPITGEMKPGGPQNIQEINQMKRKLEAACNSGIMETGSQVFQELSKNGADKLAKLKFIKEKLESIYKNASKTSKEQIDKQLKGINTIIADMEQRESEVQADPNVICRKTEELRKINKNMREKIMGLSGDMRDIREHEKKEGTLEYIKEFFFPDRQDKINDCAKEDGNAGCHIREVEDKTREHYSNE